MSREMGFSKSIRPKSYFQWHFFKVVPGKNNAAGSLTIYELIPLAAILMPQKVFSGNCHTDLIRMKIFVDLSLSYTLS
jgi:hypothetical protein